MWLIRVGVQYISTYLIAESFIKVQCRVRRLQSILWEVVVSGYSPPFPAFWLLFLVVQKHSVRPATRTSHGSLLVSFRFLPHNPLFISFHSIYQGMMNSSLMCALWHERWHMWNTFLLFITLKKYIFREFPGVLCLGLNSFTVWTQVWSPIREI